MTLEQLIADGPKFHTYKGERVTWSVHPDTLRHLHAQLSPGMSTLETGCGQTTVVFCLAGTRHTCITPDKEEVRRIRAYCRQRHVAGRVRYLTRSSDLVLPRSHAIQEALDLVFIDGAHRFPIPILDWYYTAPRLKIGGVVAVDDFRMPSVKILHDFLCAEAEWSLSETVQNTAFFTKVAEPHIDMEDDWQHQKINLQFKLETFEGGEPEPPGHPAGRLARRVRDGIRRWKGC